MTPQHRVQPRRRARAALAAAILVTFAMAAPATAAPSTRVQEHSVSITGMPISAPGASAYLQAYHSDLNGTDAGFQLWIEPDLPWNSPPTVTSGRADLALGTGDSSLTGSFELLDGTGAVVGLGTLDAALMPVGGPDEVILPKSSGNQKHREFQVHQALAVSGTVVASIGHMSYVLPLEGATASAADFTSFSNAPASTVEWLTYAELRYVAASGDVIAQVAMNEDGGMAISEVMVRRGDQLFRTSDDGGGTTFEGGRYELSLALEPVDGGEGVTAGSGGTIQGTASVRPAERHVWTEDLGDGGRLRLAVQTYTVAGSFTVSFDDGTALTLGMDDSNAWAHQVSYRSIQPAS